MNFRYPTATGISLIAARAYAMESEPYTADFDGFKPEQVKKHEAKVKRIFRGRFVQLWFCEFCRVNSISYKADTSSPFVPDEFDLLVTGRTVDCKESTVSGMQAQVSPACKNSTVGMYVFFYLSPDMDCIEPLGIISRKKFIEESTFVKEGELLPGTTNIYQGFKNGSYFIDPMKLEPFESAIEKLVTAHNCRAAA